MAQVYPDTKVIGVEPHCNDLLSQATAAPPHTGHLMCEGLEL